MTETADVIRFEAGDKVPDWILCVEPNSRDSIEPTVTFIVPVVVFDTADTIVVVPLKASDNGVIMVDNGQDCTLFSECKFVRLVAGQSWFSPRYPVPPGVALSRPTEKPSAWWRRFWPSGRRR